MRNFSFIIKVGWFYALPILGAIIIGCTHLPNSRLEGKIVQTSQNGKMCYITQNRVNFPSNGVLTLDPTMIAILHFPNIVKYRICLSNFYSDPNEIPDFIKRLKLSADNVIISSIEVGDTDVLEKACSKFFELDYSNELSSHIDFKGSQICPSQVNDPTGKEIPLKFNVYLEMRMRWLVTTTTFFILTSLCWAWGTLCIKIWKDVFLQEKNSPQSC